MVEIEDAILYLKKGRKGPMIKELLDAHGEITVRTCLGRVLLWFGLYGECDEKPPALSLKDKHDVFFVHWLSLSKELSTVFAFEDRRLVFLEGVSPSFRAEVIALCSENAVFHERVEPSSKRRSLKRHPRDSEVE